MNRLHPEHLLIAALLLTAFAVGFGPGLWAWAVEAFPCAR